LFFLYKYIKINLNLKINLSLINIKIGLFNKMYVKTFKFKNKEMMLRTLMSNNSLSVKLTKMSLFRDNIINRFIKVVLYIHTVVNNKTITDASNNPTISSTTYEENGSMYTDYILIFNDIDANEITTSTIKQYYSVSKDYDPINE
jgi:hypothetical protein